MIDPPAGAVCPDCQRGLKEVSAGVGYWCVYCHLSVTVCEQGGYALVLQDDRQRRRQRRRVPLEDIKKN